MRRFGLQYQITGWLLLVGVLPAAVVSVYAYSVARAGLFREAAASMRADAGAASVRLDESFSLARAQLVLAAGQVAERVVEGRIKPPPRSRSSTLSGEDFDPAGSVLASWGRHAPVPFESYAVVDAFAEPRLAFADGKRQGAGSVSEHDRQLAAAAQAAPEGEVVFGGVVTSAHAGGRGLTFATPIVVGGGTVIGSLHGAIPAEWFRRTLEARATLGESLWVVDDTGQLVLTTNAGPTIEAVATTLMAGGHSDGDLPARVQIGSDAIAVVLSPLPVMGSPNPWTVVVSVPERTIAAQEDPWRYVATFALLTVGVGLFAFLVGTGLTRPIKKLEEGTRRIAQGDLEFDLQVRGRNELERLAGSFLEMAYALKRAQERLTKTERMAAIGEERLAIDHEMHQAFKTVMGSAERVLARPDLPEPVREQVMPIHQAAVQMRDLLRRLEYAHDPSKEVAGGPQMMAGPVATESERGVGETA